MNKGLSNKKILITSGPTSVAIDQMRVITNRSTGEMGRRLANRCATLGSRVTILEGAVTTTLPLAKGIRVLKFFFFDELAELLSFQLKKRPDIVIHAAAIADFKPARILKGKIASTDQIILELVPTRKLINGIKKLAPETFLVGFKFEPSIKIAVRKAQSLIAKAGCNLVVANSQNLDKYQACLVHHDGKTTSPVRTKNEIVQVLMEEIL